jgi:hypothetical protein
MTNACKSLADRIEAKRAVGLVDVKFYVARTDDVSFETVCAEVSGLYDALDKGDFRPLSFMDDRKAA